MKPGNVSDVSEKKRGYKRERVFSSNFKSFLYVDWGGENYFNLKRRSNKNLKN